MKATFNLSKILIPAAAISFSVATAQNYPQQGYPAPQGTVYAPNPSYHPMGPPRVTIGDSIRGMGERINDFLSGGMRRTTSRPAPAPYYRSSPPANTRYSQPMGVPQPAYVPALRPVRGQPYSAPQQQPVFRPQPAPIQQPQYRQPTPEPRVPNRYLSNGDQTTGNAPTTSRSIFQPRSPSTGAGSRGVSTLSTRSTPAPTTVSTTPPPNRVQPQRQPQQRIALRPAVKPPQPQPSPTPREEVVVRPSVDQPPVLTQKPATREKEMVAQTNDQSTDPDYPVAKTSSKANRVISPYEPYNELDTTGLSSGQLAVDPTTSQIFRLP